MRILSSVKALLRWVFHIKPALPEDPFAGSVERTVPGQAGSHAAIRSAGAGQLSIAASATAIGVSGGGGR